MFGSSFVARIYLSKSTAGNRGLSLLSCKCLHFKHARTARYSGFQSLALRNKPSKQLSANWLHGSVMYRGNTTQASLASKKENDQPSKTHFEELVISRKEQANRSVLLHVSTKDDIVYALAKCEQFGILTNAYSYPGEGNNYFLLVEFLNKEATQEFFKACHYQPMNDIFPVFSRIIQFEKKTKSSVPKVNVELQERSKIELPSKSGCSISELIEGIYLKEKLTELDTRLRFFFCTLVKDSASSVFPYSDVFPFGSSVNGVGRCGCDLDLMIRVYPDLDSALKVYPDQVNGELTFFNKTCIGQKTMQQKVVNFLGIYFQTFLPGVNSVQRILNARVPIMKMNHRLLNMDCDVSVNNMSAILMSDVVHFCGEVDHRFRPLLYAVKKWAKEAHITHESPGSWITNFGLTNLLIYFFQQEKILPCLNDAVAILGEDNTPNFHLQYFKSIDEWKSLAAQNKKSLVQLMIEFFLFLSQYPFDQNILSLMIGKARPHVQLGIPLWVQYPFDEDLNMTKNVSEYEFFDLRNKAETSAKLLENELGKKTSTPKDFSVLLGIPGFKKLKRGVNVSTFFRDHNVKSPKSRKT